MLIKLLIPKERVGFGGWDLGVVLSEKEARRRREVGARVLM